ncbi:hypothetical protein Agabi119p4_1844 [Agaricus bisporus var. burnettii]|uniref:DUF7082 domain-containing protein n=1 Tax=Agaricus bisporus var. burnettii TaxID=192524 RepID=A0A8H7F848_AGABI|nr:hypothetical protein Agabi119p4_1844 [Agaricus bisporus var. burnettii]
MQSSLQTLQTQIQDLTELYDNLQSVRTLPQSLLTPAPAAGPLRPEFVRLKELAASIRSPNVQQALQHAQDSLNSDATGINSNFRRESRKRRRPPSPASPQPYVAKPAQEPSVFPPADANAAPLTAHDLLGYIREHNRERGAKLQIWLKTAAEAKSDRPQLLRFMIPDVVIVYISVSYERTSGAVVIENMAAFGPREKKAAHEQSEYTVFQNLSQQFARVLHSNPNIPFQSLMNWLAVHEGIFKDPCTACGRVLSVEGHVPPVVRAWKHDVIVESVRRDRRADRAGEPNTQLFLSPRMLSASRHAAFLDTNIAHPSTADPASLSSVHIDPPASSSVVISPSGTIHVLGYTPSEGERGVPITVRIHFQPDGADALFVRLVVGQKAIATKVRELPNYSYGRWQLDANIPPNDSSFSSKVLLSVQALNDKNEILDSVTFGEFSYWSPGSSSLKERTLANHPPPRLHIPSSLPDSTALRRRSATLRQLSKSPVSPTTSLPSQQNLRLHRRMKSQSLMRTKNTALGESTESLYAQTPILELLTPLSSICTGWTPTEAQAGRRLVRFSKVQDGRRLIVSCEPIRQDEYCENDSVISCIYREETDTCFVTSVDVIYLLERLTNGEFPVEEKNRIRRNLEGLRPTTVSKHKPGFGDFFQRIMEFPDPKPRNIEKDLKVFDWNLLGQALEKILSKYSIYTTSAPDSDESPPVETPTAGSPELVSRKLPTSKEEHNSLPIPIPNNSATTSPAVSVYPLLAGEATGEAPPASEATCAPWAAEFKPTELGLDALNLLSSYDSLEPNSSAGHNFTNETASYDYRIYDSLTFDGMPDEALGSMGDHYQVG